LTVPAHCSISNLLTSVEPVKVNFRTIGFEDEGAGPQLPLPYIIIVHFSQRHLACEARGTCMDNGDRDGPVQPDLEMRKLELERFKARLDYRKFVLGSVFVALAIAAIPPLFQLATAVLEYVKTEAQLRVDQNNKEAERLGKQEEFYQNFIVNFLPNALNQDIELRIRLAEYFSSVSTTAYRQGWIDYRNELTKRRDKLREEIDRMEVEWQNKALEPRDTERDQLARKLTWMYKEIGYLERDRSVAANPRSSDLLSQIEPGSFYYGDSDRFPEFGPRMSCAQARASDGPQTFAQNLCGQDRKPIVKATGSWSGGECGFTRFLLACVKEAGATSGQ
jgi:hypothetical protein